MAQLQIQDTSAMLDGPDLPICLKIAAGELPRIWVKMILVHSPLSDKSKHIFKRSPTLTYQAPCPSISYLKFMV